MARVARTLVFKLFEEDGRASYWTSYITELPSCDACAQGKLTWATFSPSNPPPSTEKLGLSHTDLCGPFTAAVGGYTYFITFLDAATGMS